MSAFTGEGSVPTPSQPGSIYVDLLEAVFCERKTALDRLSASEALAQVLRHRRNLVGSGPDHRGWAAGALADQVAYDSALIAYARRVGLECDPRRFGNPGLERQRIERVLGDRGIPLDLSGTEP